MHEPRDFTRWKQREDVGYKFNKDQILGTLTIPSYGKNNLNLLKEEDR